MAKIRLYLRLCRTCDTAQIFCTWCKPAGVQCALIEFRQISAPPRQSRKKIPFPVQGNDENGQCIAANLPKELCVHPLLSPPTRSDGRVKTSGWGSTIQICPPWRMAKDEIELQFFTFPTKLDPTDGPPTRTFLSFSQTAFQLPAFKFRSF